MWNTKWQMSVDILQFGQEITGGETAMLQNWKLTVYSLGLLVNVGN
jgi:hypothetical protein